MKHCSNVFLIVYYAILVHPRITYHLYYFIWILMYLSSLNENCSDVFIIVYKLKEYEMVRPEFWRIFLI